MGQTLSEPITEKHTSSGGNSKQKYAVSDMQGWRISMEDASTALLGFEEDKEASFFAVFDGHGGAGVAHYAGQNAHFRVIQDEEFAKGNYAQALKNGFLGLDEDLKKNLPLETSGCTAVTLLITSDNRLFCANAGDSRCVLSCAGVAEPLSYDHKPTNESEMTRIVQAGGFVQFGRVNGNLALSRAFGDFDFKRNAELAPEQQIVTADPEIKERKITPDDEFVVLACDGIWDVLSSQQVVDFVRSHIARGFTLEQTAEKLLDRCLARDPSNGVGCDNMTVIIVGLQQDETDDQWLAKCKRVAMVNGVGVDPLKVPEPGDKIVELDETTVYEDTEEKFHF